MVATHKPLLGFGPLGVAAVVVGIALLVPIALGVDLRFQLLRLVWALAGPEATYDFTILLVSFHFSAVDPTFDVFALLLLVIAAHVFPYRIAWWRWAPLVVWCLVRTHTLHWYREWQRPLLRTLINGPGFEATIVAQGAFELVACLLLWFATGSRMVALVYAALTIIVTSLLLAYLPPGNMFSMDLYPAPFRLLMPLWYAIVAALLLTWGIRARRALRPDQCRSCGHLLRGVAHECCPECGRGVGVVPA